MPSSSMMQRCYAALDLPMGATFDDAKKAYRDLVSVWHPDRISTKNPRLQRKAEERLKEINSAYQLLSSYYRSSGKMPFPSPSGESAAFAETAEQHSPGAGIRPKRRFAGILLIFAVVLAGTGFYYYHKLQQIDLGHRVAREMLELSEAHVREVITNLAVGKSVETTAPEEAPAVSERPRPLPVIKMEVLEPEEREIDSTPSDGNGDGARIQDHLVAIDKLIDQAESFLVAGQYSESLAAYESALVLVTESSILPDAERRSRKALIESGMACDEITYGARGYVYYRHRWVSPEVYRKEFVTYRGQKRHFKDMIEPLSQVVDAEVAATLVRRYPGQTLHKKMVTCLDVELIEKSSSSSRFRALYGWEVWTFNGRDRGQLVVAVTYFPESNQWRIGKITDP